MVKSKVIVIGGGLSGLISSYELLKRGYDVEIIESSDSVGGLAKSIPWNGDYIDLGPHIYHTPDKDIEKYWKKEFKNLLFEREHWAKNYKNDDFYDYPISRQFINSLDSSTRKKIFQELKKSKKDPNAKNFFEYTLALAGPTLQKMFFIDYPEKVWGMSTKNLDANWAPKRVEIRETSTPFYKNQFSAVGNKGSGTIMFELQKKIIELNGKINLKERVINFKYQDNLIDEIITNKRKIKIQNQDIIINTTSITNISKQFGFKTNLKFRGIKLVYLKVKKEKIFPNKTDFVYFDSPDLIFNRISDQNSFIKKPFSKFTVLCCEITYNKNDKIDKLTNKELINKTIKDFNSLKFVKKNMILGSHIVDLPEVYPMYYRGYQSDLAETKSKIDSIRNMYSLGSLAEFSYSDLQVLFGKGIDLAEFIDSKTLRINKIIKNSAQFSPIEEISLGNKKIGSNNKVFVIAEIGLNHNGDINLAKKLVDAAIEAKADAVKLQSYKAYNRVSKIGKTSRYVEKILGIEETDYEMLLKNQLTFKQINEIYNYAKDKIQIFSAPFDIESLNELERLNTQFYKIASFDLINVPLLKQIGLTKKPIILSTGMSNLSEIEDAINILNSVGNNKIALLHCTSSYPCSPSDMNIRAIDTLKYSFKRPVGLSDHVIEDTISLAAVARGANLIEKHLTLDKNMEGPDHILSLEPLEFKNMVKKFRDIENSLGNGIKQQNPSEFNTMVRFKKTIYAKQNIKKGQIIKPKHLTLKGPAYGILPKFLEIVIGHKTKNDIPKDQPIIWDDLL